MAARSPAAAGSGAPSAGAGCGRPALECRPERAGELRSLSPDEPPGAALPWPFTTPLSGLVDATTPGARVAQVFDAADARLPRMARDSASNTVFAEGSLFARFRMVDVVPFAAAGGCLRPPVSIGGCTNDAALSWNGTHYLVACITSAGAALVRRMDAAGQRVDASLAGSAS
jgi:hypothetical protein